MAPPRKAAARGRTRRRVKKNIAVGQVIRYDGPFPYIDGLIMQATQRLERLTLTGNAFLNRLLACERMRSPSLTEPPQQNFIRSVEKEHLNVVPGIAHIGQNPRQRLQKLPGSQVDAESDPSDSFVVTDAEVDEFWDERRG